jgi:spermidine dehydrogenase
MANKKPDIRALGPSCPVSRRDFVNGVLVGTGAALLSARAPAAAEPAERNAPSGSSWTGYGGVGDYRWSNGNTEAVRDTAHGIRDHRYPDDSAMPISETYDLVVIGGGFSGLTALYEFNKRHKSGQTCLLLENHPIVGGEAKQNEFDVEGRRLIAPQGSNAAIVIKGSSGKISYGEGYYQDYADYWREMEMPGHFELEALSGGAEKYNLPNDHFDPMVVALERRFATGYFFRGHGWAHNPSAAHFKNTPWPVSVQNEVDDFVNNRRDVISSVASPDRWLDSLSYYDLLDKLGYGPDVKRYIDPYIGVANYGVCGNAISAYAARRLSLPGTIPSHEKNRFEDVEVVSFPGGNAAILRTMLTRIIPDAISGDGSLAAAAQGSMNFEALDRPDRDVRIRAGSTAVRVHHDGDPADAGSVIVTYAQGNTLRKVRAKAVVVSSGGWVTRNIVTDLPDAYADAYRQFRYGPILTANVALRNWRFFDKLGFTVARWFAGLGWHVCVRRNVAFSMRDPPLTPNSPIVLTFYIPFLYPKADPSVQGSLGRAQLLATSYADFERQIVEQMSEMFGSAGFDARRDIAGIVLNRWGHSYFAPAAGFFFGAAGKPAPHDVIRKPHGRIVFAHSELQGNMSMARAMWEGRRGALQAIDILS